MAGLIFVEFSNIKFHRDRSRASGVVICAQTDGRTDNDCNRSSAISRTNKKEGQTDRHKDVF